MKSVSIRKRRIVTSYRIRISSVVILFGVFDLQTSLQCKESTKNPWLKGLTVSTLQTETDSVANSEDSDETAHKEPFHLDPYCFFFFHSGLDLQLNLSVRIDIPKC